uniref:hypothetical protein n=1 Tax=Thaumasiovibrio occultus TaxID=1891184 RepID=UPI000B35A5D8|nr:hypothetical protein [Thaumasiovibrio occultus]
MFKKHHIYFRVKSGEVELTHIEGGKTVTAACAGLSHPRTLMGDFFDIENCFKTTLQQVLPKSLFTPAPLAVIQLLEAGDGGYTNVEIRAFREAALGAGARDVVFAKSQSLLSADEIRRGDYPTLDNP